MGAEDVKLNQDDISAVRKIAEEAEIPGDRYEGAFLEILMRDTPPLPK